jgi:hypothetical protein
LLPPNSPNRRRQNGDSKKKVKREHPLERPQAGSAPQAERPYGQPRRHDAGTAQARNTAQACGTQARSTP